MCQAKFDVARFLIKTSCLSLIDETFMVKAGGLMLRLKVIEDTQGPLRICTPRRMVGDASSLSLKEEVDEDCDGEDCDSEAEEVVGVGGTVGCGKLGSKGVEVGTIIIPSLSNINDDGTIDMVLGDNSSDSRLHGIYNPILLETHEISDESKGVGTAVRSEALKYPLNVGPTTLKILTDVL